MRFALLTLVLMVCGLPCLSQITSKNRVYIQESSGIRNHPCRLENTMLDESAFEKLKADPKCGRILLPVSINFEKQSLVTYTMRGDCRISGSAAISSDEQTRLYTVHLSNYWGRCRAGGTYSGWLLIDKIPDGFDMEFEETKLGSQFSLLRRVAPGTRELVDATEADLDGCVWLGSGDQMMIASEKEYLAAVRKDAQTAACKSKMTGLNFSKYSYIGININSGHCRRPPDLGFLVEEYGGSKTYVVEVHYASPFEPCRALSRYDLWIRVPQTETKYSVIQTHRSLLN